MIVDFFTGIGGWPFRQLKHTTARQLVELLDVEGIDKAVAYPVASILAKDCMDGNRDVAEAASSHPSRIIPFACINPAFSGWETDFTACFERMGFQGLRLFPTYHGYRLGDRCTADLLGAAQAKHIPVALAIRVEDERQHHWLMNVPALDVHAAADVISAFPQITFVISGATYNELLSAWHALKQCDNWCFDIGRMQGRHDNPGSVEVVVRAVATFGAGRMLFGSNAPFQYIKSSLLKVIHAEIEEEDRQLIQSGNALRVLAKNPGQHH